MHSRYRVHDTQQHVSTHLRRASTSINPRYVIIDKTNGAIVDEYTTRSTAQYVCADMNREHRAQRDA